MSHAYVNRVKNAVERIENAAKRLTEAGQYHDPMPVGETVSDEGVDFGLFHNAVKEYATTSEFNRYQQVVDRAKEYVDADQTDELSRDELTTLLQAAIEVEIKARSTAEQYDNLEDVYDMQEIVEKGLMDPEVAKAWRDLSDDELEERAGTYLDGIAKAERIRRETPEAENWYETIQDMTQHVEEFVQHNLDDDDSYETVKREALDGANESLAENEKRLLQTYLGKDGKLD